MDDVNVKTKGVGNGSVSVVTSGGGVLCSVFLTNTDPDFAAPILVKNFGSLWEAEELVLPGDFEVLLPDRDRRRYFIHQGDSILDCMPETFSSLDGFEDAMLSVPYGWNYIFKDGEWFLVEEDDNEGLKYTQLKHIMHGKRKRKNNE